MSPSEITALLSRPHQINKASIVTITSFFQAVPWIVTTLWTVLDKVSSFKRIGSNGIICIFIMIWINCFFQCHSDQTLSPTYPTVSPTDNPTEAPTAIPSKSPTVYVPTSSELLITGCLDGGDREVIFLFDFSDDMTIGECNNWVNRGSVYWTEQLINYVLSVTGSSRFGYIVFDNYTNVLINTDYPIDNWSVGDSDLIKNNPGCGIDGHIGSMKPNLSNAITEAFSQFTGDTTIKTIVIFSRVAISSEDEDEICQTYGTRINMVEFIVINMYDPDTLSNPEDYLLCLTHYDYNRVFPVQYARNPHPNGELLGLRWSTDYFLEIICAVPTSSPNALPTKAPSSSPIFTPCDESNEMRDNQSEVTNTVESMDIVIADLKDNDDYGDINGSDDLANDQLLDAMMSDENGDEDEKGNNNKVNDDYKDEQEQENGLEALIDSEYEQLLIPF